MAGSGDAPTSELVLTLHWMEMPTWVGSFQAKLVMLPATVLPHRPLHLCMRSVQPVRVFYILQRNARPAGSLRDGDSCSFSSSIHVFPRSSLFFTNTWTVFTPSATQKVWTFPCWGKTFLTCGPTLFLFLFPWPAE
jgi:hypothetical protein